MAEMTAVLRDDSGAGAMHETTLLVNDETRARASRFRAALRDIAGGVAAVSIWNLLGWQDIRQRYRRSVIGPFWLTISMGVMVAALGFLYAHLFKTDVADYMPFVATGLIVWSLVSALLGDSCVVFTGSEGMIKQVHMPLTVHVCRMVWRNMIVFFHNAAILVILAIWTGKGFTAVTLTVPLALLVLAINGVWAGIALGALCARFRDIAPIIANIVQLLFFISPIMWKPEALSAERAWIAHYNPLYHYIEIVRAPLLDHPVPVWSWTVVGFMTMLGIALAVLVLTRSRHRVVYWV